MTFKIEPGDERYPHLPEPLMRGMQTSMDLEMIIDPPQSLVDKSDMWEPGQAQIGGYFLPPFQRPLVWSETQKERLVESALLGISIGTIVVVDAMNCPMPQEERFAATDRWLLDGQQRCAALIDYRNDKIRVFRGTPCEHGWSDLNTNERRRFWHIQIGVVKIQTDDPAYCREIYDRLNFGGTIHIEDQRAIKG